MKQPDDEKTKGRSSASRSYMASPSPSRPTGGKSDSTTVLSELGLSGVDEYFLCPVIAIGGPTREQ